MRKYVALALIPVLVTVLLFAGCSSKESEDSQNETTKEELTQNTEDVSFNGLDDPELLMYVEDGIVAGLEEDFRSDDYVVENVQAIYLSKEYLEEVEYNSLANVYFGYTRDELEEQFQGEKYIFTLGDDGTTVVKEFEAYDDTYEQVIKNVAIGTGVILLCVTVSVATAGAGAPAVSLVFAASAKTGTMFALSSGVFSGVASATVTGFKTKDFDAAMKAGMQSGSEGFKWGAITGALVGGASEAVNLHNGVSATSAAESSAVTGTRPTPRESELAVLEKYGGREQVSYLNGKEMPYGTPNATRPDVVRNVNGKLEAIEVKNYDLKSKQSLNQLYKELDRQVTSRVNNLPEGSLQRVVLDTRGRDYSNELIEEVIKNIQSKCSSYPNLPIDVLR